MIFTTIDFSFNDLWNRTLSLISADFVHDGVYTCQVRLLILIPLVFHVNIPLLFGVIIHVFFDFNSNISGEDEDGWSDPEKRGEGESNR